MENLNLYDYKYIFEAYQHLDRELGNWIYIWIIPLYKIRTLYIYTWWKLILLHLISFISFVVGFNNADNISEYFNITYAPLSSYTLTFIVIIYLYTSISIIFMYVNALTYERHELIYNLKTTWNFTLKVFKVIWKIIIWFYVIIKAPLPTTPLNQTNTQNSQKTTKSSNLVAGTKTTLKPQIKNPTTQVKPIKNNPIYTNTDKSVLIPNKKNKPVTPQKKNLKKVYTNKGYIYHIQAQSGFGGEATVHPITKRLVAKIFKKGQETAEKERKIIKLSSLKIKSVVFPERPLYDENKSFIGYSMGAIKDSVELAKLSRVELRDKFIPHWTEIDFLDLTITVSKVLKNIHNEGLIISDFNPRNILVKNPTQVYFIDTDSFQIDRSPSGVGISIYMKPMHFKKSNKRYLKKQSDDIYALSVMVFQSLMTIEHPYTSKEGGTQDELTEKHEFSFDAYDPKKCNVNNVLIDAWFKLSTGLREYFCAVFGEQKQVSLSTLIKHLVAHKKDLLRVQTKTRRK